MVQISRNGQSQDLATTYSGGISQPANSPRRTNVARRPRRAPLFPLDDQEEREREANDARPLLAAHDRVKAELVMMPGDDEDAGECHAV